MDTDRQLRRAGLAATDDRRRRPVAVVGAGPVGLAAAIDLALHDIPCLLLDDNDTVSVGSRAICWARRTLEIFDRLGVGERIVRQGVTWHTARVYDGDREIYCSDLTPEPGHKMPAFVNLQQYHVEQALIDRAADFPELIDLRWKHRVTGVENRADGVVITAETPDGLRHFEVDWLIACDGARSPIRQMLGLDFRGEAFEDRFLIADVEVEADFPAERRFWFEPTFHAGHSALLHKQPDNLYRIDLQLGADADPEEEKKPERVVPRIAAILGDRPFGLVWVSVYTFQCRRLARFVHDRVIFAGDSAHVVSPFGARGGNGGIQDVDNLAWKLAAVLRGDADEALIASYDEERGHAADENIRNSARSTRFMTPKSTAERLFRRAVLDLAADHAFARRFVNSGRLSTPCSLAGLSLQSDPDNVGGVEPGHACPDVPLHDAGGRPSFLLDHLGGDFAILAIAPAAVTRATPLRTVHVGPGGFDDRSGLASERYGGGRSYLVRPDQHIAARFTTPTPAALEAALARSKAGFAGVTS